MMDGRNPYGSRGGYVTSRRGRRDRGDYNYDMANDGRYGDMQSYDRMDYQQDSRYDNAMDGRNYQRDRQYDMANDYNENMSGQDGHYPMVQGYIPIEAMGRFTGYYGMGGGEDYGMDGRNYDGRNYGRNNRDSRDYMDSRDYGRYGRDSHKQMKYLPDNILNQWSERLKKELDEKDKQMFEKSSIKKKAEEMGIKFDRFSFEEFYVAVLMMYTDYCKTLGSANMDTYLRLAKDWLCDEDVSVKYGEKLAMYYNTIVEGM